MEKIKGLHPADMEVLEDAVKGRGTPLTPKLWKELKIGAAQVSDAAEAWSKENVTVIQAELIRLWRADEGYSWRSVAAAAHREFGGDWQPDSNQLWGQELCRAAANILGEDPEEAPWN